MKEQAKERILAMEQAKEKIALTQEKLEEAWQGAIDLVAADKVLYKSAISESIMKYEKHEITIHANLVALDFLKPERLRLLDFFKRYFQDEDINVLFAEKIETATIEEKEHSLSTREIFEKMATKNPFLRELKDRFGFDLEY